MATEKQIAANQFNAQLSHGPITPEGKATSSQNRTVHLRRSLEVFVSAEAVHGLNYNPETFRVLACESQADYDAPLEKLMKEQRPAEHVETLLVTSMARSASNR